MHNMQLCPDPDAPPGGRRRPGFSGRRPWPAGHGRARRGGSHLRTSRPRTPPPPGTPLIFYF